MTKCVTWYLRTTVADLLPHWLEVFLPGGMNTFLKVLKQTSGRGDETWDAFNLKGINGMAAQWWWFQQLQYQHQRQCSHPLSQSRPLPQLLNICLTPSLPPDPGLTMAARQPSSCRPPAVSVPAPRIHAPPYPLPQSTLCPSSQPQLRESTGVHGVSWKSGWSLLEVMT